MICSSVTSLLHYKRSKHPRTKMIEKCNICHQTVNISSHSHKEPNTKHVCSECNKKFASKINLKIHIRTHTKEKPYKCMKCNILFSQASGLSTHKLACNDIREVPCTLFLKKFRNESEKNRHIKTVHMKQRNFKCKLCRKAFSDLTPLKYHIKSAHGDGSDLFQCNICNKTITTKRNLIKHKNKFHKVQFGIQYIYFCMPINLGKLSANVSIQYSSQFPILKLPPIIEPFYWIGQHWSCSCGCGCFIYSSMCVSPDVVFRWLDIIW